MRSTPDTTTTCMFRPQRGQGLALLTALLLGSYGWAFSPVGLWFPRQTTTASRKHTNGPFALIYGWDDTCDTDNPNNNNNNNNNKPEKEEYFYYNDSSCTSTGVAVAERLSYDPDRVGSLARLAVAFSPPERALTLQQIEKVNILCVEPDRIDIQAMVCEDGGCVSLSVPIKFPQACGEDQWLEGCVTHRLEQLDRSLPDIQQTTSSNFETDHLDNAVLLSNVVFPSWWIPPPTPEMMAECRTMRDILNEEEFAMEIGALAQQSLDKEPPSSSSSSFVKYHNYQVQRVKVIAVGPAGLLFRVQTMPTPETATTVLDVLYPFGRGGGGEEETIQTVDALRATILGLVATA